MKETVERIVSSALLASCQSQACLEGEDRGGETSEGYRKPYDVVKVAKDKSSLNGNVSDNMGRNQEEERKEAHKNTDISVQKGSLLSLVPYISPNALNMRCVLRL